MNEQLTKEEYQRRQEKFSFTSEKIVELRKTLQDQSAHAIHRSYSGMNNTDVGDYVDNCDNVYYCFDGIGLKDSAFCDFTGVNSFNMYDCTYGGIDSSICYQSMGFTNFNSVLFQIAGRNMYNSMYNQYCYSSHDIFGSIGITQGEYCIFNKRYSAKEYAILKGRIIEHIKKMVNGVNFSP